MAAIAVQDVGEAQRFLARFAFSPSVPEGRRRHLWSTLLEVLGPQPTAGYEPLARRLTAALPR